MFLPALVSLTVSLAAAAPASEPAIAIDHTAVRCVIAETFPRLRACIAPAQEIAAPRVYFRGEGDPSWYYVEMSRDGDCFTAVLPRPLTGLARVDYYVWAQSSLPPFGERLTPTYSPPVYPASRGCDTPFAPSARLRVIAADGGVRAPLGFSADGLEGLAAPARRAGIAGVVLAGGAAGVAALAAGSAIALSGDSPPSPTAAPTSSPTPAGSPESPTDPAATPRPTPGAEVPPTTPAPTAVPTPDAPPPTTLVPITLPPTTLPPTSLPPSTLPPITLGAAPEHGELAQTPGSRPFAFTSTVEGSRGHVQLVLNGRQAWMPGEAAVALQAAGSKGPNCLDLAVVHATAPGLWKIELAENTPLRRGSLRVAGARVVRLTERAVWLRIGMARGERAMILFDLQ